MHSDRVRYSIKNKLFMLSATVAVPFLIMVIYLIYALHSYSNAYKAIVNNMTVANNYNLNFKEEMDESLYKLVVGSVTFETVGEEEGLQNPYGMIEDLRSEFGKLMRITTDGESRAWLQILMRNIDTLEDRVDDIRTNLEAENSYDMNIEMLDNNIYIMTELVQDNIQSYIYYQTKSIEHLTQQLNDRVHTFTLFCGGLLALLVVMVIVLTMMIVAGIIKPIQELSQVTRQISQGDFSARARTDTHDEVAQLADSVNSMTESLEELVGKIKEDERKMRHADLRLLQEQINPHFLYNTLDTMKWMAKENGLPELVSMSSNLAQILRMSISARPIIRLSQEIALVEAYTEIQKIRFEDKFELIVDIPEDLAECMVPKLTLQPIVENAIIHGLAECEAGMVLVQASAVNGGGDLSGIGADSSALALEGETLQILVQDDGAGMTAEEVKQLNETGQTAKGKTSGHESIGYNNVDAIIRLHYGEQYGLYTESEKGAGTKVYLLLPLIRDT